MNSHFVLALLLLALPASATADPAAFLVHETGTAPRVGPGAMLFTETTSCAASFAFRHEDGAVALATAGHCFRPGDRPRLYGTVEHEDQAGNAIGTVTLVVDEDDVGADLALVTLDADAARRLDPTVPVVGGPCGWRGPGRVGEPVALVGPTLAYEGGAKARHGVTRTGATPVAAGDARVLHYAVERTGGDSGAPVLYVENASRPLAAAIHTSGLVTHGVPLGSGVSIPHALHLMGPGWSLVESPDCGTTPLHARATVEAPERVEPRDDDGDGAPDGLRVARGAYAARDGSRTGDAAPLDVQTRREPEARVTPDDEARVFLFPGSALRIWTPDGSVLHVENPSSESLLASVRLDGRVAWARAVRFGEPCADASTAGLHVTGALAGAAADGTWIVDAVGALSADVVLDVGGKRFAAAADPDAFHAQGCPASAFLAQGATTWNWHEADAFTRGRAARVDDQAPWRARIHAP